MVWNVGFPVAGAVRAFFDNQAACNLTASRYGPTRRNSAKTILDENLAFCVRYTYRKCIGLKRT
jgi:hypothetical protein